MWQAFTAPPSPNRIKLVVLRNGEFIPLCPTVRDKGESEGSLVLIGYGRDHLNRTVLRYTNPNA